MSHLYCRISDGITVNWEPDETDLGKQAVESVVGSVESYPADVTDEQAKQIREEYQSLIENNE